MAFGGLPVTIPAVNCVKCKCSHQHSIRYSNTAQAPLTTTDQCKAFFNRNADGSRGTSTTCATRPTYGLVTVDLCVDTDSFENTGNTILRVDWAENATVCTVPNYNKWDAVQDGTLTPPANAAEAAISQIRCGGIWGSNDREARRVYIAANKPTPPSDAF